MPNNIDWSHTESGFDPGEPWEAFYVIRGKPGSRKTSFVAGIPRSLILSFDRKGANFAIGSRAERSNCFDWKSYCLNHDMLMNDAAKNGDGRRFVVVSFDPAGLFHLLCKAEMERKLGCEIEGFDWAKVASLFREKLLDLSRAGYYWNVCDHLLTKVLKLQGGGEKEITEPLMPASVNGKLDQDCSYVLTFGTTSDSSVVMDPKTKKRVTTQTHKFEITTRPGKRTSMTNPKARVWLPTTFEIPNSCRTSAEMYDYYCEVYRTAVREMQSLDEASSALPAER